MSKRPTPRRSWRDLLDRAVESRLVSDVPFGAFLSRWARLQRRRGADVARHLAQPVRTFSIGFREAAYNELSDARRVAQHLGTEHHELVVEPDAVSLLQDLVWYLDEPFADSSAVPTYLVAKLAREHRQDGAHRRRRRRGVRRLRPLPARPRSRARRPLQAGGGGGLRSLRAPGARLARLSPAPHRRAAAPAVPRFLLERRGASRAPTSPTRCSARPRVAKARQPLRAAWRPVVRSAADGLGRARPAASPSILAVTFPTTSSASSTVWPWPTRSRGARRSSIRRAWSSRCACRPGSACRVGAASTCSVARRRAGCLPTS